MPGARQLVNHGHVTVNGRVTDIASYQCKPGDVIAIRERKCSRSWPKPTWNSPGLANASHLELDKSKLSAKVVGRSGVSGWLWKSMNCWWWSTTPARSDSRQNLVAGRWPAESSLAQWAGDFFWIKGRYA